MGDLRAWSLEPNGSALEERSSSLSFSTSSLSLSSNQTAICFEYLKKAEEATQDIIAKVQPTIVAENRRKAVIDYVQNLIRRSLPCEVFPFGSVPLKTYLPDGDIDLTAFGGLNVEESLANDVCGVLDREDQNGGAEFMVKDVHLIWAEVQEVHGKWKLCVKYVTCTLYCFYHISQHDIFSLLFLRYFTFTMADNHLRFGAEAYCIYCNSCAFWIQFIPPCHVEQMVKLVKCLVQNIVVDISFNQLGGLCTLCFLEKVDRLIGKDHLFKRSIILIKAWCYYESRILGAHHGLISTYALETLVLYIFHFFHSSLNGPLVVLYKFLDYFSKFDWDNYCISLNGPVRLSSLPELMAETPDNSGDDLLLTNEFLKECVDMFSVPSRGYETHARAFTPKHLNIVDPLKENNNLGRSVSKGNFYRIRSAFTYGARKLVRILSQPEEDIGDDVRKFFSNTLDRHGSGRRPDVQDPFPVFGHDRFSAGSRVTTGLQEDQTTYETEPAFSSGMTGESRLGHEGSLYSEVANSEASCRKTITARIASEPCKSPMEIASSTVLKSGTSLNGATVSENRLKGDAKDLATSGILSLIISNGPLRSPPPSIEASTSLLSYARHAPHLYFSHSSMGNGEMKDENQDMKQQENSSSTNHKFADLDDNQLVSNHEVASPVMQKNHLLSLSLIARSAEGFYPSYSVYQLPRGNAGSPEPSNYLSDLSGDYENYCSSLQYGRFCYECVWTAPVPTAPPLTLSMQLRQNGLPQMNANGIVPGSGLYPIQIYPGGMHSGMEEMPKQRGTGTFLPKIHYRDRPMTPRGRHQASARSPCNNGRVVKPPSENGFPERSSHEAAQSQIYVHKGSGKFGSPDSTCDSPGRKASPHANGSIPLAEHPAEFGPISDLPSEAPLFRGDTQAVETQNLRVDSPGTEGTKVLLGIDKDRIAAQSYHLKDDEDFPPLSA